MAAAGAWHKLLCLLWAGWRGRDTVLSSRHLPPVYQTQIEDPYQKRALWPQFVNFVPHLGGIFILNIGVPRTTQR